MSKMSNETIVWLDLTDMLVWKGHFTGVQRVVYEYAKRFDKDGSRFCAYDAVDDRYFEVTLEFIDKIRAGDEEVKRELMSWRKRVRLVLGRPYYALPEAYKKPLKPLVRRSNHTARYVMSKTIYRHRRVESPFNRLPEAAFAQDDTVLLIGAGWNDIRALKKIAELKKDIGFRIVQHLNDILPIYQPQLFAEELPKLFRPYVDLVMECADVITVISEATKRDVGIYCREHGKADLPIRVVRLGDDVNATSPVRPSAVAEGERFLLALGTFEVRKNYTLLYQALKLAQIEQRELPKIVIAGRKGWLSSDILYMISHDPYTKEHIIWLDNVSDDELAWLFDNCLFSVFPSIAEGWGLPVVESLHHGKFCLVSGVSSMLEIGEGLVDYFLPYDARECMEKIHYYIAEDRYVQANERVSQGYKVYTWDESYEQFKQAIR